ncbi:MAG: hypothetical protein ACRCYQ_04935, partial [Nocardioides sp.]
MLSRRRVPRIRAFPAMRWNGRTTRGEPVFNGVSAVLDVLGDLVDRPRWQWRRPAEGEYRGDRPLPLLCLTCPSSGEDLLRSVEARLDDASPDKIPYAAIRMTEPPVGRRGRGGTEAPETSLVPLLDEIHDQLSANRFGTGRIVRFRHYRLASWLTRQTIPPVRGRREQVDIADTLREWHSHGPPASVSPYAEAPWWARVVLALLVAWNRPLRFRLWASAWPLVSSEPRWFMKKQPFMVPAHATSFFGFAERLTTSARDKEKPDQIKKLLVHAFLQDLRAVYRPRRLRVRRWRRTAYPVVLLGGITEANGGWEFLRLINDVRNERGDLDPLLVVAESARPPQWVEGPVEPASADQIRDALQRWYRNLPAQRQRLEPDARFLFVRVPGPAVEPGEPEPTETDRAAWATVSAIQPRRPHWLARRGVVPALLTALLVTVAAPFVEPAVDRLRNRCVPDPSSGVAAFWDDDQGECLGYSDDADLVFGSEERLRAVQRAVFEQNHRATDLKRADPSRPLISLIYFSAFTHPESDLGTADSVAEELEGQLIRQLQNNRSGSSTPLVRVIVANGGSQMWAAEEVAREFLLPLLDDDPTILGVVGMNRTVEATERAIGLLGQEVPVIATTLTGEGLPDRSPSYFQMVPGNRIQADLLAAYAREEGRSVTMYRPRPDGDPYLETLANEVRASLSLPDERDREWVDSVGEVDVVCDEDEIAFYAGRETQFADFLKQVDDQCDRPPKIIGDDAVTRFVYQDSARNQAFLREFSVSWMDLGSMVVLAGESCGAAGEPRRWRDWKRLVEFCSGYQALLAADIPDGPPAPAAETYAALLSEVEKQPWPGQGVGLAYDAAGLMVAAVNNNQRRSGTGPSPARAAVTQEIRELDRFDGATGVHSFTTSRDGRTRNLAILTVDDSQDPAETPTCEYLIGATDTLDVTA